MLIGVSPVISPDLIAILHKMGHGDEIVLADAFYPAHSSSDQVIRCDGLKIPTLLGGILRLINLDDYVPNPLVMMSPANGDQLDPSVEASFRHVIEKIYPSAPPVEKIDRFAFYERSKKAFAIVLTGETVKYGNIILKKGVIPVE
ncbi:MAG: L-fucose mutarotase [Treponemataceae bacterium]